MIKRKKTIMNIDSTAILGYVAGILTTWAFLPQVIKTIKTKDTRSISLFMYVILTIGIVLWLTYGIIQKDLPIILANGITLFSSLIILTMKIKNG
jgi:MtN3 and saliva related transmembrane protein